jgi:hypothetical protein
MKGETMGIDTVHSTTSRDHLGDLGRDLADWLRARTGWPESVVNGACRLAAAATGTAGAGPVEAEAELEGDDVHLQVSRCAEVELEETVAGGAGRVHVSAHDGDVILHPC